MPTTGLKRYGVAAAVCAVVLAGVFWAPGLLIRADSVRDAVRTEIRNATGLDPVLGGGVSVHAFPSNTATFFDVSLGDGDGSAPLKAQQLIAQLRFLPLLMGRIEVAQITLVSPQILVEFDADGQSNWTGLLTTLLQTLKPGQRTPSAVSFSEIRLVGGRAVVRSSARGFSETLQDIEASLAWPAVSATFGATGEFLWRGEKVEASATLADFAAALAGDRTGFRVRATSIPLKLAFDGHIGRKPTLKLEGALSADSVSLRKAVLWATGRTLPGAGLGRFALKSQASIVGNVFSLTALNLEVDGNAAEGAVTLTGGSRPLLQGTLAANEVNATPYVAEVRLRASNDRHWDRAPITLTGFSSLDFDLRLSASRIILGDWRGGRTAVGASLRSGLLSLTIGESEAFGGMLKGSISLGKIDEGAVIKAALNFTDVDLEACLRSLVGVRRLEGKGNIALNLESRGTDVEAITRALNGSGRLTSRQGAISGLNVEQLLRRLERRPLSGTGDFRSGRTPFERLSIGLTFANGNAAVDAVDVQASTVRLALGGTASITSRQLDLKGVASLAAAATRDTEAFALPFVVRGTWDDPVMMPDVASLIQRSGAAAPLLDAVRARASREAVRSAIEQLTGGEAKQAGDSARPSAPALAPQQ